MLGIRKYKGVAIDLFQGDITSFVCDAMVNAANSALAGGGGVDGAIHRAGGPEILAACKAIGSCPTGTAVATTAGKLPAKKVIHTVGPVWNGGSQGEASSLLSCFRESLKIASESTLPHVAFPAISTGIYGYPLNEASKIAMKGFRAFIDGNPDHNLRRITVVLFDSEAYQTFQSALFSNFPET